MARKKCVEEEDADAENANKRHHANSANAGHSLLHDNTNVKGHHQQKLPLNSSISKNVAPSHHKKGNKYKKGGVSSKANSDDSYAAVMGQLSTTGLTLREMPGDGNCLFRALADQLEGNSRNHMEHRRAVVDFMRKYRPDFEPFVEDDEPFDKYIQSLSQNGTFAGNDAIVAFARLHNVTVVIHQLNSPAWLIHPSNEASYSPSGREIHIAYHNGDHYNSVRKLGDDSEAPANIKLGLQGHSVCANKGALSNSTAKSSPPHSTSSLKPQTKFFAPETPELKATQDSVYESLYGRRDEDYWVKDAADVDRLVEDVMEQTDYCTDPTLVREALMEFHFDIPSTVDYILSMSYFIMSQPHQQQQPEEFIAQCHTEGNPATREECPPQPQAERNDTIVEDKRQPSSVESPTQDDIGPNSPNPVAVESTTTPDNISMPPSSDIAADSTPEGPQIIVTPPEEGKRPEPERASQTQSQANVGSKSHKAKISSRQRKDLKKKERKREANQRKVAENVAPERSPSSTTGSSNLGSLNI